MNNLRVVWAAFCALILVGCAKTDQQIPVAETLRLYTFDCGDLTYPDFSSMSDRGGYDGRSGFLKVSCYLIQHPTQGWIAWDTGLPGFIWWSPWGYSKAGIHARVGFRYEKQLEALGLKPRDVRYVGFSHLHFDHTGNAGKFPEATWIVSEKEGAWALQEETPPGVYARSLRLLQKVKRRNAVDGLDVFGDGSVKLVSAPGHTPDHFSLLVNLKNSGPLLLVGDLYHLEESRERRLMPIYNTDREETLRSMERIEAAAKTLNAKVVIGHDPKQFDSMPAFPSYLD